MIRKTISYLCLLFFVIACRAQVNQSVQIDKFDRLPCSDIRGRLDLFLIELSEAPDSVGIVVLGDDTPFSKVLRRRRLIETQFMFRNFNISRIRFVRRQGLPELGVELWKVPSSGDPPFSFDPKWEYAVSKGTKPFIVYDGGYNESECYFPIGGQILSEYLKSNPGSRGNVVIRCNGVRCFNEQKKMILEDIADSHKPLKFKIRFFYVPIQTDYFSTEFWLLP